MNFKNLLFCTLCFVCIQLANGQGKSDFLYSTGDDNRAVITMGSPRSAHCTVIEYPDFLVLHEIPKIPKTTSDSTKNNQINPLIAFIDSIYSHKPIKYILNSHSHGHSLSTITPFLENGAKLVTAQENLEYYYKKGLLGDKKSGYYSESIIPITSDTLLLTKTNNPIKILYLEKSDYPSIPTSTYLFFYFPKQKLLSASCMCSLKEFDQEKGYSGTVYSNRLVDVNKIISDKSLDVENVAQMYYFIHQNNERKPPVFKISYLRDVLKNGWSREEFSEHLQKMSYNELTLKRDSLLNYLTENSIYSAIINHAVYKLIEKKEYSKAVALAQILVIYYPINVDYIDTLGEAYFNNNEIQKAKYYNTLLNRSKVKPNEEFGLSIWEKNRKERLEETEK